MSINIEERIKEIAEQKESLRKMVETDVFQNGIHYRLYGRTRRLMLAGVELLKQLHELEEIDMRVESHDLGGGHREYQCYSVVRSSDGKFSGTGLRVCSTKEKRFCYDLENTNKRPSLEWFSKRDQLALEGNTEEDPYRMVVLDSAGKAFIFQRIEAKNPARHFNMVSALAHKRAMMAAVINAVGATDLFEIESEVLTHDYEAYLDEKERQDASEGADSDDEASQEDDGLSDEERAFRAICMENEGHASEFLRSRDLISFDQTWKDLSGDNKGKVLSNLTYFKEQIEKLRVA